jgi:hypothetical protein
VALAGEHPSLREQPMHWMLIDLVPCVLPEFGRAALSVSGVRTSNQSSASLMSAVSKVTGQDKLDLPKRLDYLLLVGTDYSAGHGYGELRLVS